MDDVVTGVIRGGFVGNDQKISVDCTLKLGARLFGIYIEQSIENDGQKLLLRDPSGFIIIWSELLNITKETFQEENFDINGKRRRYFK